jgi:hypothetical protein
VAPVYVTQTTIAVTILRKTHIAVTILHKIHYSIEVPKKTHQKTNYWFSKYNRVLHHYFEMYQRSYSVINRRRSLVDDQQLVKFINKFQPGSRLVRQFISNPKTKTNYWFSKYNRILYHYSVSIAALCLVTLSLWQV